MSKFSLGLLVSTPGALEALQEANQHPITFLKRHQRGDWGNLWQEDKRANNNALKNGSRLFSAYILSTKVKIWIITESDRSTTTILLPDEY